MSGKDLLLVGGVPTVANYIEDVFSTWLYTGNGTTQTINNGIDLSGKGGLVWNKVRGSTGNPTYHYWVDTARGRTSGIGSNSTDAAYISSAGNDLTSFNSNGFSVGAVQNWSASNTNSADIVSWTFREQPKFFDIVTYTGNGTSGRSISHNLGSTPGMIVIKRTDSTGDWVTWHRALPDPVDGVLYLNSTNGQMLQGWFSNINSTSFTITSQPLINASGGTYVAYLFAHDAGGFGLSGTDNVISCGSFTSSTSTNVNINLGYEVQFLLIKLSSSAGGWYLFDNMRGMPVSTTAGSLATLLANTSGAEDSTTYSGVNPTSTGFTVTSTFSSSQLGDGQTCIYIAIRRPMKTPTSGTSVYYAELVSQADTIQTTSVPFPGDLYLSYSRNGTDGTNYRNTTSDRLRGLGPPSDTFTSGTLTNDLMSNSTNAGATRFIQLKADSRNITRGTGWNSATYGNFLFHVFRRAPGFMDVVCYSGNGTARSITHNLGVAPEFLMIKRRNSSGDWSGWTTYATPNQNDYYFGFNLNSPWRTLGDVYWGSSGSGTPSMTSTTFGLGTFADVNASGGTYVAYLFATLAGVSKVGTYTGNGSSQTINCGFTAGARFILIKRLDVAGSWYVWDSARGIVPGDDPYIQLNNSAVEGTVGDSVDTASSGFIVNQVAQTDINIIFSPYFFLAIA